MRRIPMHMSDWLQKLDGFLTLNDRSLLDHAGRISHEIANELAESEYGKFNTNRIADTSKQLSDFDKVIKQIEATPKKKSS